MAEIKLSMSLLSLLLHFLALQKLMWLPPPPGANTNYMLLLFSAIVVSSIVALGICCPGEQVANNTAPE